MAKKIISADVVWHQASVHRSQRQERNGHKSMLLWFTGLSGAGKSTLSFAVEEELHGRGFKTYVLDGDNVRHGVCGDLGFSADARKENIRRIGEMGKLFVDAGIITFSAFISPFKSDRRKVRDLLEKRDFVEIYCNASLEICEQRDVKGMYKKARKGIIKDFTGISSPYEKPESPELIVHTGELSLEKSAQMVIDYLEINGYLER